MCLRNADLMTSFEKKRFLRRNNCVFSAALLILVMQNENFHGVNALPGAIVSLMWHYTCYDRDYRNPGAANDDVSFLTGERRKRSRGPC